MTATLLFSYFIKRDIQCHNELWLFLGVNIVLSPDLLVIILLIIEMKWSWKVFNFWPSCPRSVWLLFITFPFSHLFSAAKSRSVVVVVVLPGRRRPPAGRKRPRQMKWAAKAAALVFVNLLLICLDCNVRRGERQELSVKLLVINSTDTEVSEATCLHYSLSHCHRRT